MDESQGVRQMIGSLMGWNEINFFSGCSVFSNVLLVCVLLCVSLFIPVISSHCLNEINKLLNFKNEFGLVIIFDTVSKSPKN